LLIQLAGSTFIHAEQYEWGLPPGFPTPLVPANNPMTVAKVNLGRTLFYDPILSSTETVSCATCHQQRLAFTDGLKTPVGESGDSLDRSAMSLVNLAYRLSYGWTNPGRQHLEEQMLRPLFSETPVEMGAGMAKQQILSRLVKDVTYTSSFLQAFPDEANPVGWPNIIKAIASFERTLISGHSTYDVWVFADVRPDAGIVRGMKLFFSEHLACGSCHGGIGFSNEFHFLPKSLQTSEPIAQFHITGTSVEQQAFRAPSLRNIAVTSPYMHDGRFTDLESVIAHYASGPAPEHGLAGFYLTDLEKKDLIQFLDSLTDQTFLVDKRLSDPLSGKR
jgi:cytochrome c peroxidase